MCTFLAVRWLAHAHAHAPKAGTGVGQGIPVHIIPRGKLTSASGRAALLAELLDQQRGSLGVGNLGDLCC